MSGDEKKGGLPLAGPLGELFPTVRTAEAKPVAPIHRRVLDLPSPEGQRLTLAVFRDPGGAAALHREAKKAIEAALLAELCSPEGQATERRFAGLGLALYPEVPNADQALRAFGLRRVDEDEFVRGALAHFRGEAQRVGADIPDTPAAFYRADAELPPEPRADRVRQIERALGAAKLSPWGVKPGSHYVALAQALAGVGETLSPDMAGLDLLETIFGQQRPGILRFIPPRFFLAIADTIGVVAAREFGAKVAWSDASPDDEGFAPPPLLRIATKEGEAHIPAALHLLTWCIMPLADGEVAPALSEWALDQFGWRS